ncbi:pentapeptide repeat-containing protein [Spirillospora sp. NPDC048911]|uniref:pentapeptide repeat-containing protein n=1 Tax=Spirillospora sp. NPDC048911 TaxID=3364527 RepID=UPI003720C4ED
MTQTEGASEERSVKQAHLALGLWSIRRALTFAVGTAVLLLVSAWFFISWLLGSPPHAEPKPLDTTAQLELLKLVFALVAGVGALVALVTAYRRQRVDEAAGERAERMQAHSERVHAHTEYDAVERRVTELYGQAIEHLGHDKAAVRLGGLYSLERLGRDHPKHRQTVTDVICAYLRMPYQVHAQASHSAPPDSTSEAPQQELQVRLAAQQILKRHLTIGQPDQERPSAYWDGMLIDLTGAQLIDFDFGSCSPSQASFTNAEFLGNAAFHGAQFSEDATFQGAQFKARATFGVAFFGGNTRFDGAQFADVADFGGVRWDGIALFERVQFPHIAEFGDAKFGGVTSFSEAQFGESVQFDGARFKGIAEFTHAKFGDVANFSGVRFGGITAFDGAQFGQTAKFGPNSEGARTQFCAGAVFDGARFAGTVDFESVQFSGITRFQEVHFDGAISFHGTCFDGITAFGGAQFSEAADFKRTQFAASTEFDRSRFVTEPDFEGATTSCLSNMANAWPAPWEVYANLPGDTEGRLVRRR